MDLSPVSSVDGETDPVLAAHQWNKNADLIADMARLGYLRPDWLTLDPTYGRGNWWTTWRPERLVTHDLRLDGVDFRRLPEADTSFDAVAYDPPYVCIGGRKTTTMPDFHDRFGLTDAPGSPAELQELINGGLSEAWRVVKPEGIVLAKCQDYVSSGKLWIGTHHTLAHAIAVGFEPIDRLEMVQARPRPQPLNRHNGEPTRQVHARRNLSTLLVLRRPRGWPSAQIGLFDA